LAFSHTRQAGHFLQKSFVKLHPMCFFSIHNIIDIDIILWPCGNLLGDAFSTMTSYAGVVKKISKRKWSNISAHENNF
jgi:hypothetical protein